MILEETFGLYHGEAKNDSDIDEHGGERFDWREGLNRQPEGLNRQVESLNRQPEGLNRQPEGLNRQVESLNRQPEGLNRQPEGLNRQPESLKRQLESLKHQLKDLKHQLKSLNHQLEDLKRQPESLNRKLKSLKHQLEGLKHQLKSVNRYLEGLNRQLEGWDAPAVDPIGLFECISYSLKHYYYESSLLRSLFYMLVDVLLSVVSIVCLCFTGRTPVSYVRYAIAHAQTAAAIEEVFNQVKGTVRVVLEAGKVVNQQLKEKLSEQVGVLARMASAAANDQLDEDFSVQNQLKSVFPKRGKAAANDHQLVCDHARLFSSAEKHVREQAKNEVLESVDPTCASF